MLILVEDLPRRTATHVSMENYYASMADHPSHFAGDKFGFRVLVPWIVHILPLSTPAGFKVVTLVSLALTSVVLYFYIRSMATQRAAGIGVGLFLGSGACVVSVLDPYVTDPLAYLCVVGALALVRLKWIWPVGIVIALGVIVRESSLVVLLPLLVIGWRRDQFHPRVPWILVFLVPLATYQVVHLTPLLYGFVPDSFPYLSVANVRNILQFQAVTTNGLWRALWYAIVGSFGAAWVLATLARRAGNSFLRSSAIYVVPVAASMLIASDWVRMLAFGFPVVIPFASHVRLRALPAIAIMILMAAGAAWPENDIGTRGLLVLTGFFAVGALIAFFEWRRVPDADRLVAAAI